MSSVVEQKIKSLEKAIKIAEATRGDVYDTEFVDVVKAMESFNGLIIQPESRRMTVITAIASLFASTFKMDLWPSEVLRFLVGQIGRRETETFLEKISTSDRCFKIIRIMGGNVETIAAPVHYDPTPGEGASKGAVEWRNDGRTIWPQDYQKN